MSYIGTKPANAALTASDIADDIISLAKMSSGTDGNLITYDASGNPAAVATGTSGHFLKSQGAGSVPVFAAAAAGGATTLIQAQTASNSATIDFTSNFSSSYDVYRLDIIQSIPTADAAYFTVALSDDGGSSWENGAGYYNAGVIAYDGSVSYGDHDGTVFWTNGDAGTLQGNAGILESLSGSWYFYGLEDGNHPHVSWQMAYGNVSGEATINIGSGIFQGNTNDIDGIRILYTSTGGNIVSGKFRLYGIKNS